MSAVPSYPPDHVAGISDDLLMLIFDFLTQPELLHVAHVSSRWRVAARSHPSFYRYISLNCDCRPGQEKASLQLAAWVDIADECLELGTAVGIRIAVSEHGNYGVHAMDASTVRGVLLPRLQGLLAQTVYLDLRMQGIHADALLRALISPAPRLSSLKVHLTGGIMPPLDNLSAALFGGYAPNLRELELYNVPLDHAQSHPAFGAARALSISPSSYKLLVCLPDTFPSVTTLNMHIMKYKVPMSLGHSDALRCVLRSIRVRAKTHFPRPIVQLITLEPRMNVDVEFMWKSLDWSLDIEPLVAGLPDPLDLCITHHWFILWVVRIRSTTGERTIRAPTMRSVLRNSVPQTPLLLVGILPLLPRVSSLEIGAVALPQTASCLRAELPALRSLTLSVAPPSPSAAVSQWVDFLSWISVNAFGSPLRCTGLERMTLCWRAVPPETYHDAPTPPVISQTALLNLARAFTVPARIELRLLGIVLQRNVANEAAFNSVFYFEYKDDNWVYEDVIDGHDYLGIGIDL